jgi:uncharacterized protein
MVTKKQINAFFEGRSVAIAGVSRDKKKFGFQVFKTMKEKGSLELFPVNPNADEILGHTCYHSIGDLPDGVQSIVILTRKDKTEQAVTDALQKGMKNIWIQQMSQTPEALRIAGESGANVIHGKCIMMFAEPVSGVHKFHRALSGFFGRLPK